MFVALAVWSVMLVKPQYAPVQAQSDDANQESSGLDAFAVAHYFPVSEPVESIKSGMIVSHRNSRYSFSTESYDKSMFGVISLEPAVSFSIDDPKPEEYPVITSGTVIVMVSATNGPIKKGDDVTTSNVPGIGMKANQSGFTLGVAQTDFNPPDPQTVGTIPVSLEIKFNFTEDSPESAQISTRLKDLVSLSAIAAIESPTKALQYLVAAFCLIGSMAFAIFSFIRAAHKGIDALGRNPLAKSSIGLGILINATMSVIIALAGLMGAYFMLSM